MVWLLCTQYATALVLVLGVSSTMFQMFSSIFGCYPVLPLELAINEPFSQRLQNSRSNMFFLAYAHPKNIIDTAVALKLSLGAPYYIKCMFAASLFVKPPITTKNTVANDAFPLKHRNMNSQAQYCHLPIALSSSHSCQFVLMFTVVILSIWCKHCCKEALCGGVMNKYGFFHVWFLMFVPQCVTFDYTFLYKKYMFQ